MKHAFKFVIYITLLLSPVSLYAWKWLDLWQTPDQQGTKLLQAGKAQEAAQTFKNKNWRAVAQYRAGDYTQAFQAFIGTKTSDDQYNAGNAAAFMRRYQEAIAAYDKAIALNPNNADAITNRDIIKKLLNKQKQQNKNSANNKDNKNENQKDKQNMAQNNNGQNNQQQDKQQANNQQSNSGQPPTQQPMGGQQKEQLSPSGQVEAKDEDKKQMLRRLADDPGGLLRQKFLRDYIRRHAVGEYSDQGDNQ